MSSVNLWDFKSFSKFDDGKLDRELRKIFLYEGSLIEHSGMTNLNKIRSEKVQKIMDNEAWLEKLRDRIKEQHPEIAMRCV